jgi:hypothetical protein
MTYRHSIYGLLLVLLAIISTSCGVYTEALPPEELGRLFAETIPGTWASSSSSGGKSVRMIKQYHRDGTASGVLLMKDTRAGVSLVMPEIPFTSKWRVKGDVVESYVVRTGVPGLFKRDEVIRDRLVGVSRNRIVARSEKSGSIATLDRVSSLR